MPATATPGVIRLVHHDGHQLGYVGSHEERETEQYFSVGQFPQAMRLILSGSFANTQQLSPNPCYTTEANLPYPYVAFAAVNGTDIAPNSLK